jgi:hypothetical protein
MAIQLNSGPKANALFNSLLESARWPLREVVPAVAEVLKSTSPLPVDLCNLVAGYVALPPERFDETWELLFWAAHSGTGQLSRAKCLRFRCPRGSVYCNVKYAPGMSLDASASRRDIVAALEDLGCPVVGLYTNEHGIIILVSL